MRTVILVTTLLLSTSLAGCTSSPMEIQPSEENQNAYCPSGSIRTLAGTTFIVTDPGEGYFSTSRDSWPWQSSMMGKLNRPNPKLKLVCVAPYVLAKGFKQRPAVYVPVDSDQTSYIFGITDSKGVPQGVTEEGRVNKAQALVGKTLWFTGSPTTEFYQRLDNLRPYTISRIEVGKTGVCKDILLIVPHNGNELKLAVSLKGDQTFKPCYGAELYDSEPTASTLAVQQFEFTLIKQKTAAVGMSERALLMALGAPDTVNRTTLQNRSTKQYVFRSGTKYVYVEDGVVVAIQD